MQDVDGRRMSIRVPRKLSKSRRSVIFSQSASHAGGRVNLCVVNGRIRLERGQVAETLGQPPKLDQVVTIVAAARIMPEPSLTL